MFTGRFHFASWTLGVCLLALSFVFACGENKTDSPKQDGQGSHAVAQAANEEAAASTKDKNVKPAAEKKVAGKIFEPKTDTSRLSNEAKKGWLSLVNDLLSPCGEPVSIAQCSVEKTGCGQCDVANRYVERLVFSGYQPDEIRGLYQLRFDKEAKFEVPTGDIPYKGAPMAAVRIVEFSDFQCPFCKRAAPMLAKAVKEFDGKVKLEFRQYPLPMHNHAFDASRATIAAGRQGKFWEMHDILFKNQKALEMRDIRKYAEEIGLDMPKFLQTLASEGPEMIIERDRDLGKRLGVDHTPFFIVNGRVYEEPLDHLSEYLKEEIELGPR